MQKLLSVDAKVRLGASSADEVKRHAWFVDCDWRLVYERALRPPLVPTIHHDGDTGNFDSYDEVERLAPAPQRLLDLFDEW